MFRFTIREIALMTALMAVGFAWWLDHRRFIVARDRLDTIVAELVSRNLSVEIDDDGIWISNP